MKKGKKEKNKKAQPAGGEAASLQGSGFVKRLPESYRTIYKSGEGRYEEKKSVFIASVRHVTGADEAASFVEEIKKQHWDARHNCYAWILGKDGSAMKASDDGEPSGTAGRPILDVLQGAGLTNVCMVVTRYFGGVLLGTGGLVRAYTQAARDGIEKSVCIEKRNGIILEIRADYTDAGKIQYMIGQDAEKVHILNSDFSDVVCFRVILPVSDAAWFEKKIVEATSARAEIQEISQTWFGLADGKILTDSEDQT
ncbi:MAG: YigZ family protein [Eubacterium sp.]|nr:YigZ family protein [Eubacterium sp.]